MKPCEHPDCRRAAFNSGLCCTHDPAVHERAERLRTAGYTRLADTLDVNSTPTLDTHLVGLPGWKLGGRHVRLADVLAAEHDPTVRGARTRQHAEAAALLRLAATKLDDELREAAGPP